MKAILDFDDAGAGDDHPARGVTVGDIRAWHDDREQLVATIDRLLTCGNHIALYRTDRWPGYVLGGLTRDQQCENALRTLGATQDYDLWCCWSGMMQARDELNGAAPKTSHQQGQTE